MWFGLPHRPASAVLLPQKLALCGAGQPLAYRLRDLVAVQTDPGAGVSHNYHPSGLRKSYYRAAEPQMAAERTALSGYHTPIKE
jgi:hypothetical protein